VKHLKQYKIQFSGLAIGSHDFEFDISDAFFDSFPYSIVKKGTINAMVNLNRQANLMVLSVDLQGHVSLECDKCLSEFKMPIDAQERLIVKFNDEEIEEHTDEIVVLGRNDYEIDLSEYLYESIHVNVPTYVRCDELGDTSCDEEMVDKIQGLAPNEESEAPIDPRWEALKRIKNN
jgi:uncharacterized protein